MATDFDWTGFRALAKRLEDLLGGDSADAEFAQDLRRALTFLYTAGITMPAAGDVYEAAGEEFWSRAVNLRLDQADAANFEGAVTALAQRIVTSVDTAQPEGDVEADDIEELAEMAAASALEVVSALAEGNRHFDEERPTEAAWEWTFQFDEWGTHALGAMTALHELLWGAR